MTTVVERRLAAFREEFFNLVDKFRDLTVFLSVGKEGESAYTFINADGSPIHLSLENQGKSGVDCNATMKVGHDQVERACSDVKTYSSFHEIFTMMAKLFETLLTQFQRSLGDASTVTMGRFKEHLSPEQKVELEKMYAKAKERLGPDSSLEETKEAVSKLMDELPEDVREGFKRAVLWAAVGKVDETRPYKDTVH